MGTICRFLLEADASQGDTFYLIYGDDGTFDVEMAPPIPEDRIQQALRLAGCSPELSGAAALDALGASISVGVRKIDALEQAFRSRGDVDIADLLAAVAAQRSAGGAVPGKGHRPCRASLSGLGEHFSALARLRQQCGETRRSCVRELGALLVGSGKKPCRTSRPRSAGPFAGPAS